MPPICAALLIPAVIKPINRLMPMTINKVFLSKIKRCCFKTGNNDIMVSAAPKPITAPDAPAPTLGSCSGFKAAFCSILSEFCRSKKPLNKLPIKPASRYSPKKYTRPSICSLICPNKYKAHMLSIK